MRTGNPEAALLVAAALPLLMMGGLAVRPRIASPPVVNRPWRRGPCRPEGEAAEHAKGDARGMRGRSGSFDPRLPQHRTGILQ